ncbi:MAG: carboxypeptidase-like regulatory domain-containing protein, partial [Clostridiales bacterium]|nr:carboxypeptidase-like regulatory domain-containing protein [Clostridiales bacterium]
MKKLFLLLMTVILTTTCAMAQAGLIHGTVVSASTDEPLIGASVVAPDGQGVATDFDGNFALKVAPGTKLKVSYIGYSVQTIPAADGMIVKLVDDNLLNEVVVTGYGS